MLTAGRSPGRPRADTDPDTRARALLAAQVQFGERGFSGVSMDQLAEAAGVNVRAIYHYFDSKRARFDAAVDAAFETYAASFSARWNTLRRTASPRSARGPR